MIKTVIVQSVITTGGLAPGQQAEVEDTEQTRDLIGAGFWTLLVPDMPPVVNSVGAELTGNDLPGLSD